MSLDFNFSRPDRLRDIADRFNVDQDAVLDNVLYARAYTSAKNLLVFFIFIIVLQTKLSSSMRMFHFLSSGEHQMELLDFVAAKFHEEGGVFKLLVGEGSLK